MPTPFDVQGTTTLKTALIITAIVAAGLVFAFTPFSAIGYVLFAIAAAVYVFVSVTAGSR